MPQYYELTKLASEDLKEIARYTVSQWGIMQAQRYQASLETCFREIADRTIRGRTFIKRRRDLLCVRFERHFIFFVRRENKPFLILAVLHEKMDLIQRIEARLKE